MTVHLLFELMPVSRRNLLIALGGIAAGGGTLLGTGAFTSVQADRSITVETAGDADAFLALEPTSEPNGEYAETTGDTLEVAIGEDGPGVNLNAITHVDRVFRITNRGTQAVVLYFEETSSDNTSAVDVGTRTDQLRTDSVPEDGQPTSNGIVDTRVADISDPSPPDSGAGYGDIGVLLGVGDALDVGFYIDTSDDNLNDGLSESAESDVAAGDRLLDGVVVYADAGAANDDNYQFEAAGG